MAFYTSCSPWHTNIQDRICLQVLTRQQTQSAVHHPTRTSPVPTFSGSGSGLHNTGKPLRVLKTSVPQKRLSFVLQILLDVSFLNFRENKSMTPTWRKERKEADSDGTCSHTKLRQDMLASLKKARLRVIPSPNIPRSSTWFWVGEGDAIDQNEGCHIFVTKRHIPMVFCFFPSS